MMKKKLQLNRITKLGGLLFLMMFGLMNAQTTIFSEGFENSNGFSLEGALSTAAVGNNGWRSTATAVINSNNWSGFSTGGYNITNRSLMISAASSTSVQYPGQYYTNLSTNKVAYATINSTGYTTLILDFDWRSAGERSGTTNYDYGQVVYRATATDAWTALTTGGYSGGVYVLTPNVTHATINLPAALNNRSFQLGFRWICDNADGSAPAFVVDNIFVKGTPISSDRTLTVSNAYTGASYPNGSHTVANNTSVIATSGTRAGYNVTGWTGTGSVPATGTTGSSTFTITQNSTIDWTWQQIGIPNNISFYNYGGTEQLTFNNSRIKTTTPVFRLSHQTDPATEYEIQINTLPNFTGTSYTQTFTGTYPLNTPANFTFSSGFTPNPVTTYYVRARVKGSANTFSSWTTETYSFTYETPKEKPDWFQTTQTQFTTDALSGTIADPSNDVVVTSTGGNVITNGSFETTLTGWTISKPAWYTVASEAFGNTLGTNALNIYNTNPGSTGNFNGDNAGVYQTVNMSGVSTVSVDLGYESTAGSNLNVNFEIYISDVSQTTLRTGTKIIDWRPTQNISLGNTFTFDVTSLGFTGSKLIKIVAYLAIPSTDYAERYFYIDNIRTTSLPQGTITSTPIALSSVQNVNRFEKLLWNQTLGGGTLNFKIQQTTLGGTSWTDVAEYTNISATGDGLKEFDLSGMTGHPQIRLVGTLNGANVKMHDWAIIYEESCEKTWSGTSIDWATSNNWTPSGIPTASHCVKIPSLTLKPTIQVGTNALAKNLTIESGGELNIKGNLTVTDFVENKGNAANLIIESDANLLQINTGAANTGEITLKRASKMKRLDYIYWGSPVAGQSFINFSPNTVASRFYRYNEEFDSFHSISNLNDSMIAGEGYAIRAPNNQNATTPNIWTGIFVGQPNNGGITFPVTKHPDSPIDPNNSSSEIISRGKNMLSNPYPSNLDLEALTNGNLTTANGVYYFWTNTNDFVDNTQVPGNGQYGNYGSNHYATYSSSGAVPAANEVNGQLPTRYIRPGQGFLFEAKSTGTVTFNNNMRSADPNSNFISNRETENSPERFWLKLTTPINNSNTLLIAYIPGATDLFEPRYDAKFPQKSSDRFYSIIDDKELIIQGRQYPFSKTDLVTLGMAHFAAGNYKIEISDREGIFSNGQKIYLKDKQTGVITNLSQESYSYTAEAGENNTRFEIIYEPETVLIANESVKGECIIYRDASDFVVKSKDKTIENIELYDASGRLVLKMKANNNKELRFNAEKLHQGMYIVKVITKVGVITKKIINY